MKNGLLQQHKHRLPMLGDAAETPLSLGEGDTPLIALRNLPRAAKLPDTIRLWVKFEGANPTGSFKDRGMVAAVAAARAGGIRCVICASTGNTSASAAAYAARAGMTCVVLIPVGKIASGKMAQAVAYGAKIIQIEGNFDDAMTAVRAFADDGRVAVVNSINPMRLQGQKTAAFEIIEELGEAPHYHALPVGNAGNITAHWIGYSEAAARPTAACAYCQGDCSFSNQLAGGEKPPVMLGYQAAGAAPFISGGPVANPETVATAIRIGNPQSFAAAQTVIAESGGHIAAISDDEILAAQRLLAASEGVFCEPASAASIGGVINDIRSGKIADDARVVCTLTGHGLKDPDIFPSPQVRALPSSELATTLQQFIDKR